MDDTPLMQVLERSLNAFIHAHDGQKTKRIALHRDGRFFESLSVIKAFEQKHAEVDVLEIIKSGTLRGVFRSEVP